VFRWINNLSLTAFVLALRKAVLAVYGTVIPGLERDFAFFLAFGANRLVHFTLPAAKPATATTALVPHATSFLEIYYGRNFTTNKGPLQQLFTEGQDQWLPGLDSN